LHGFAVVSLQNPQVVGISSRFVGTFQVYFQRGKQQRKMYQNRLQVGPSMNDAQLLYEMLPYRMHAVSIFNYALQLRAKWTGAPSMTILIDGKQVMEGNLDAFTNPAIEAGLVHCRALLEFLGLCNRNGVLSNIRARRNGDVGIESFSNANGPLPMVTPDAALDKYKGERAEAERALLSIFHVANKGLAHTTQDLSDHPEHGTLLEIASRGIPSLVVSYLYTPLGIAAPGYKITSRPRDGQGLA
jgi:hypothetical protein